MREMVRGNLILTFSREEKEQRRCVRVARAAGVRLQCRVVVVIPDRAFLAAPDGVREFAPKDATPSELMRWIGLDPR